MCRLIDPSTYRSFYIRLFYIRNFSLNGIDLDAGLGNPSNSQSNLCFLGLYVSLNYLSF